MKIKNLVLSGGSIKGISFLGSIKFFEEYNIMDNLESICGTSIGSLIGTLICLNYTYSELKSIFMKLNFDNFQDIDSNNIINFFNEYGVDSGDNFLRIIEILIKAKTNNSKITFKELYEKTNIKLIVTATCVNSKKLVYYNYEDTPQECVALSIRKSISIPFLFKPILENDNYYVDGALINNFPIDFYDNDIDNTLGIIISEDESNKVDINSFDIFLLTLIECSFKDSINKIISKYKKNIIIINTNIHFLNFFISNNQKEDLISLGYKSTIDYFDNYFIEIFDYGNLVSDKIINKSISQTECSLKGYKLYNVNNNPIIISSKIDTVIGRKYFLHKKYLKEQKTKTKNNIKYLLKKKDKIFIYEPIIDNIEIEETSLLKDGKWK